MAGVEVAGIAPAVFPLINAILKTYDSLLQIHYRSSGDESNILRIQILTQQARLKSLSHRISKIKIQDSFVAQYMVDLLTHIQQSCSKFKIVQRRDGLSFDSKNEFFKATEFTSLMLNTMELRWLNSAVEEITDRINTLENLLPTSEYDGVGSGQAKLEENPHCATQSHDTERVLEPHRMQDTECRQQLLRELISAIEGVLRVISASGDLREIFLSYLLWSQALLDVTVSEILADALKNVPNTRGPDLPFMHIRALAHMASILCKSADIFKLDSYPSGPLNYERVRSGLANVRDYVGQDLEDDARVPYFDLADFPELLDDEAFRTNAIEELKILVNTLLSCVSSILRQAQIQRIRTPTRVQLGVPKSINLKEDQSATIKALLGVSTQLAGDIIDGLGNSKLENMFVEGAGLLRKWIKKNEVKMGGKLTSRNPAIWTAIAENVFNVINLLCNISCLMGAKFGDKASVVQRAKKLLEDYAKQFPELEVGGELHRVRDINVAIKDFRACVKSLIELEAPLEHISPPPAYEQRSTNKVYVNVVEDVVHTKPILLA